MRVHLADAGADLHSFRNPETGYDLVQTAANLDNMDAALKLVEAGCKWQLPKGQRVLDGFVHYAPEILSINSPTLKVRLRHGCTFVGQGSTNSRSGGGNGNNAMVR